MVKQCSKRAMSHLPLSMKKTRKALKTMVKIAMKKRKVLVLPLPKQQMLKKKCGAAQLEWTRLTW